MEASLYAVYSLSQVGLRTKMIRHDKFSDVEIIGADSSGYQTEGSAGLDLVAKGWRWPQGYGYRDMQSIARDFTLFPGDIMQISTGVFVNMTFVPNLFATVHVRSSIGIKGLVLANCTGIIDNDYQGEIFVVLRNVSNQPVVVKIGDRIAQLVFQRFERPSFRKVDKFSSTSVRGASGFGSTGE